MRSRKIQWGSSWRFGELCEVPRCPLWRGLRHHCPMYNVSYIFFNKCLYVWYCVAGCLLDRLCNCIKSLCCTPKVNLEFYVNYISFTLEKYKGLRNFNFVKLIRKPRQKLVAEPKSEIGRGLTEHGCVVDSSQLEYRVLPLSFGLLLRTDGRVLSNVCWPCFPTVCHFCFSSWAPFMAHIQPRKPRQQGAHLPPTHPPAPRLWRILHVPTPVWATPTRAAPWRWQNWELPVGEKWAGLKIPNPANVFFYREVRISKGLASVTALMLFQKAPNKTTKPFLF